MTTNDQRHHGRRKRKMQKRKTPNEPPGHTPINDLPDELLENIAWEVYWDEEPDNFDTLRALCTVNRRLYRIVGSVLYYSIHLDHDSARNPVRTTQRLLCTLSAAPELGKYSHVLEFDITQDPIPTDHVSWAIFRLHQLATPDTDQRIQGIISNSPSSVLASLLFDAQHQTSQDSPSSEARFGSGLIRPGARGILHSGEHTFQHLSSVRVHICTIHSHRTSVLFRLPALHTLELNGTPANSWEQIQIKSKKAIQGSEGIHESWECPPRSSTLQSLAITGVLPSAVVAVMVESVASLQNCQCWAAIDLEVQATWFREVGAALLQHLSSLKHVDFFYMELHWMAHPLPIHGGLEILVSCPSLEIYRGPMVSLLSHEQLHSCNQLASLTTALPQTITRLVLDMHHSWDPSSFLELTDRQAWKIFPQLKTLFIRFQMTSAVDQVRLNALPGLEEYFEGTSVRFAYRLDFQYASQFDEADYGWLLAQIRATGPDGVKIAKNCRFLKHAHARWLDYGDSDEEE